MKRELPSTSKDSYKGPNPTKKQATLDLFIKVQKTVKEQPSEEKKTFNERPGQNKSTHNSKSTKHLNQDYNLNDPTPYKIIPMSHEELNQLTSKYLNVHFTYACQQCFRDITNYTKIKLEDKIYCVQCAANIIDKIYTVIKALHDESLEAFTCNKLQWNNVNEPIWSLKDELRLIEALQLYGIDSYELIKEYMRTDHTIEEIRAHQEYFIAKFAPQLTKKQQYISHKVTIEVDIDESEEDQPQKRPPNVQELNQMGKKLLKIFQFNQKRDEFQHDGYHLPFSLLASQITTEDLFKNPQIVQIINQRTKYELIEKRILQNALKTKIMSLKNHELSQQEEKSPQKDQKSAEKDKQSSEKKKKSQEKKEQTSEKFKSKKQSIISSDSEDEEEQPVEKLFLSEEDKWALFECQVIRKYNILNPDTNSNLKKFVRRTRLIDQVIEIRKEGEKEVKTMRNVYCKENGIDKMSIDEFGGDLSQEVIRRVFKMDEVDKIKKQLEMMKRNIKSK